MFAGFAYSFALSPIFVARKATAASPMDVYLPRTKSSIPYPAILAAFAPDTAPIVPLTPGSRKIIGILPTAER